MSPTRFVVLVLAVFFFVACGNEKHVTNIIGPTSMGTWVDSTEYLVWIDNNKSIEDMIKEGQYDSCSTMIDSYSFDIIGKGFVRLNLEIVHFDLNMGTSEVEKELDLLGLRPARIEELLAFGAKYPDIQREYRIMGLGSSWVNPYGRHHVPFLGLDLSKHRRLSISSRDDLWSKSIRFLTVRKELPRTHPCRSSSTSNPQLD